MAWLNSLGKGQSASSESDESDYERFGRERAAESMQRAAAHQAQYGGKADRNNWGTVVGAGGCWSISTPPSFSAGPGTSMTAASWAGGGRPASWVLGFVQEQQPVAPKGIGRGYARGQFQVCQNTGTKRWFGECGNENVWVTDEGCYVRDYTAINIGVNQVSPKGHQGKGFGKFVLDTTAVVLTSKAQTSKGILSKGKNKPRGKG